MVLRPAEVPGLINYCGYDYCVHKPSMKVPVDELLEESTLPSSVVVEQDKSKSNIRTESAVTLLLRAALVLAEKPENAPANLPPKVQKSPAETLPPSASSFGDSAKQEIPVPGGILPVSEAGNTQQVHVLTKNKEGIGILRSPSGEERPLTEADIELFKKYFIDLGKLLDSLNLVSNT